jgi:hypothetical protein
MAGSYMGPGLYLNVCMIVLVLVIWIKLIRVFRLSPMIGPLMRIFKLMTKQLAIFSVFYFFVIFLFSEFGRQSYTQNKKVFGSSIKSFTYFFDASLGNFSFKDFENSGNLST